MQTLDLAISCNRVDLFVGIGLTRPLLESGWLKGLCRNRVDFVGIGLTSFVGIGLTLLELGWLGMVNFRVNLIPTKRGQICWNRVDSTFVGNGLTRVNFQVNPIPTKKGQICWNWVDWRLLAQSSFSNQKSHQGSVERENLLRVLSLSFYFLLRIR